MLECPRSRTLHRPETTRDRATPSRIWSSRNIDSLSPQTFQTASLEDEFSDVCHYEILGTYLRIARYTKELEGHLADLKQMSIWVPKKATDLSPAVVRRREALCTLGYKYYRKPLRSRVRVLSSNGSHSEDLRILERLKCHTRLVLC